VIERWGEKKNQWGIGDCGFHVTGVLLLSVFEGLGSFLLDITNVLGGKKRILLTANARKTKTNARRSFFWVKNCVDLGIENRKGCLTSCIGLWSSLVVSLLLHQFFVLAIFLFSCVVMFSSFSPNYSIVFVLLGSEPLFH